MKRIIHAHPIFLLLLLVGFLVLSFQSTIIKVLASPPAAKPCETVSDCPTRGGNYCCGADVCNDAYIPACTFTADNDYTIGTCTYTWGSVIDHIDNCAYGCSNGSCNNPPPPTTPNCDSGISCSGACTAPTNTCSTNNGTEGNCVYTTYSGGGSCNQVAAPDQSCSTINCSDGYSCDASGTCTPLPSPSPGCGKVCTYSQSGLCYSGNCLDGSQNCSTNVNCGYVSGCSSGTQVSCGGPNPTPNPTSSPPPPGGCTVGWTISNSNPAPNTNITVNVRGLNDPRGWQNVRLLLDGNVATRTSITPGPQPTFNYTNTINSGSSGGHTLVFTTNNNSYSCSPTASFTTAPPPPPACQGFNTIDTPVDGTTYTSGITYTPAGWSTFCSGPNGTNRDRVDLYVTDQGQYNYTYIGAATPSVRQDVVNLPWTCGNLNPNPDGWYFNWTPDSSLIGAKTLRVASINDPAATCVKWQSANVNIIPPPPQPITWTINAQPICSNGATPRKQTEIFYKAGFLSDWSYGSLGSGTRTQTITTTEYVVWLGLLSSDGIVLNTYGTPPNPAIYYVRAFNPLISVAEWNTSALPAGTYTLQFQAPDSLCLPPSCDTGASCGACGGAPINTCSANNGSQTCTYTTYSGGGDCSPVSYTSSCTYDNCDTASGYVCTPSVPPGTCSLKPWIQTTGGDVHSNVRINTPGGP